MEKLEELENKVLKLLSQIEEKEKDIENFEKGPLFQKYKTILNEKQRLVDECNKISSVIKNIKAQCCHPLWYLNSFSVKTNSKGKVTFEKYEYQCIYCEVHRNASYDYGAPSTLFGVSMIDDRIHFNQIIFEYNEQGKMVRHEIPFKVIRKEFLELESEGYSLGVIRDILYSKYTEKNEDLARNLKMKYVPKQGK